VTIAEHDVHNSQGFQSLEYALTAAAYAELGNAIEKALAAPASDSFAISASPRLER
jgi:hypothetical protein